ncbi:DinB/UmuC family translesion DNA polymerase [Streptomyces sp. NPDC001937]
MGPRRRDPCPGTGSTASATSRTLRSLPSNGSSAPPPADRPTTALTGRDDRPVVPQAAPRSAAAEHRFDADGLNPDQHHQAVLGLVDELGARMRSENSVCCAIALAVRYADRTHTTRTRTLTEPTAHSPALANTGLALLESLGLQRARVRAISVRAGATTARRDRHPPAHSRPHRRADTRPGSRHRSGTSPIRISRSRTREHLPAGQLMPCPLRQSHFYWSASSGDGTMSAHG